MREKGKGGWGGEGGEGGGELDGRLICTDNVFIYIIGILVISHPLVEKLFQFSTPLQLRIFFIHFSYKYERKCS